MTHDHSTRLHKAHDEINAVYDEMTAERGPTSQDMHALRFMLLAVKDSLTAVHTLALAITQRNVGGAATSALAESRPILDRHADATLREQARAFEPAPAGAGAPSRGGWGAIGEDDEAS